LTFQRELSYKMSMQSRSGSA